MTEQPAVPPAFTAPPSSVSSSPPSPSIGPEGTPYVPQTPAPQAPASYGMPEQVLDFTVPRREILRTAFRLLPEPHIYRFTAPKIAVMMMPILEGDVTDVSSMASLMEWLGRGLDEADNHRILARLRDPEDDLDIETVGEVVKGLIQQAGGNRPSG